MPIATGINKRVKYKLETAWGVKPAAASAQSLRRISSDLNLKKEAYESSELRDDYQVADMRHGVRSVEGGVQGELSPGTYKDFFAAAVRQLFQAVVTTGAQTTISAVANTSFNRSAGSFLTDGFKIGDVVRATGMTATANNARNFMVTDVTALALSGFFIDGTAVAVSAAGPSTTIVQAGKKTFAPTTGHTDQSFSIEHWFSDVALSEVYTGCKVSNIDVQLPSTGMATTTVTFMGKDVETQGTEYFTSPIAQTTTGVLAAVNGAVLSGGVKVANIVSMNFAIASNMSGEAVIGSNTKPELFEGRIKVSGQLQVFFENATLRDQFINETEAALVCALTADNSANADFVSFVFPRVKLGGCDRDDGEAGLKQTIPFTALLNSTGGAAVSSLKTTMSIQDSIA